MERRDSSKALIGRQSKISNSESMRASMCRVNDSHRPPVKQRQSEKNFFIPSNQHSEDVSPYKTNMFRKDFVDLGFENYSNSGIFRTNQVHNRTSLQNGILRIVN